MQKKIKRKNIYKIFSGSSGLRDLYCVLECDRVHKARTVVRYLHLDLIIL